MKYTSLILLTLLSLSIIKATNNKCNCNESLELGYHWDIETQKCETLSQSDQGYVENCHQHKKDMSSKQITCEICKPEYYIKGYECKLHNLQGCIKATDQYNNGLECLKCDENHIFNSQDNTCLEKPQNLIQNCKTHYQFGQLYCSECNENFYVKDNECIAQPTSGDDFVQNCQIYSWVDQNQGYLQCQVCKDNYFYNPKLKQCVSHTDTNDEFYRANCVRYGYLAGSRTPYCGICQDGHYSKSEGSSMLVSCVKNPLQTDQTLYVANCESYYYNSQLQKPECDVCQDGYYLNHSNNTCDQIQNPVQNCNNYSFQNNVYKCLACKNQFFSVDSYSTCNQCPTPPTPPNGGPNGTDPNQKPENSQGLQLKISVLFILFVIIVLI